ncbi:hypothetical protein [Neisseria zoodegmatis]|uniref:Uncharacterized protein n=1 Tax=Neisseria zoodegmatis TaxID=326523 RepID=A0AB38DNP3_9NEIS|nr:hypothetical protein [Neisseria zoodegmatis]OSI09374.1 hypothetical protein BWD10_09745 [Neisseria zoodegmatis]SNU78608.1 Uncharacterised protein [Neisseria zoodegmatis]
MQINLNNMLKHWKLLLVLIIVFQPLSGLVFYWFDIQDISVDKGIVLGRAGLSSAVGALIANIVFFVILKCKK